MVDKAMCELVTLTKLTQLFRKDDLLFAMSGLISPLLHNLLKYKYIIKSS